MYIFHCIRKNIDYININCIHMCIYMYIYTGWCSTTTLLLICSSFSRENGHLFLICSSLSTAQYIYNTCLVACPIRYPKKTWVLKSPSSSSIFLFIPSKSHDVPSNKNHGYKTSTITSHNLLPKKKTTATPFPQSKVQNP